MGTASKSSSRRNSFPHLPRVHHAHRRRGGSVGARSARRPRHRSAPAHSRSASSYPFDRLPASEEQTGAHSERVQAMSDQNRDNLTDKEKIDRAVDRAAWREEVRFLKKQQWAVATAGVVLLSGLLAAIRDYHLTALDKFIVMVVVGLGVWCGWFFLEDLQRGLAVVRRALYPSDYAASTRGQEIVNLHKAILVGSAAFVVWIILFKVR